MRRDIGTIIVGLLFLLAGIAVGGSMLGFFNFTINFAGWWTLFLIVPALFAIAQGGINAGNIILLGIGIVLLLDQQHVLQDGLIWRLILPLIPSRNRLPAHIRWTFSRRLAWAARG